MDLTEAIRRHPARTAAVLAAGAVVAVAGFLWFRPDRLVTDRQVDEAVPGAAAGPVEGTDPAESGIVEGSGAGTATVAGGRFLSLEHETTGRAVVLETGGGRRFLRFEDFQTSDGPDLLVYLSAKEPSGTDDWHGYDADFIDLGPLKGNIGNQNYAIPEDADLDRHGTAVVWCRRFEVGFAAAVLQPV